MGKIEYKSEILDLVSNLAQINNSVIFKKEGDKISVCRSDSEKTIVYNLEAPLSSLCIEDDQIAFYNYTEFYQFFSSFNSPSLEISGNKIMISENESNINYLLTNPEVIKGGPKTINFGDGNLRINIDSATLDSFSKMSLTLIKAKHAKIYGDENKVNIKIFNDLHDNSFEKSFVPEVINNYSGKFEFHIFTEIFTKIPNKRDYTFDIRIQDADKGYIRATLVDPNTNLSIYTGYIKS